MCRKFNKEQNGYLNNGDARGAYHWENSHFAGCSIRNKVAISTMVRLGGGGFTIIKIAKVREIG